MTTVHLITGAPCAGKTTHVNNHRHPDDALICWDTYLEHTRATMPGHSDWTHRKAATILRNDAVRQLLNGDLTTPTVWYIRCLAGAARRAHAITQLEEAGHTVHHTHLDPGLPTLLERAAQRPNAAILSRNIIQWYELDRDLP